MGFSQIRFVAKFDGRVFVRLFPLVEPLLQAFFKGALLPDIADLRRLLDEPAKSFKGDSDVWLGFRIG